MPVQFFGQYLLEKKIISREQLLEAVAHQESQNLKLGEHAVRQNYLTQSQADSINHLQQTQDLRFGDAAVELGLLTPAQVDELVTIQRNSHVYLGEAIVRKEFATKEIIDKALKSFQDDQAAYRAESMDLERFGVPDHNLFESAIDLTQKLLLRMWDVQCKLGEPTVQIGNTRISGTAVQVEFSGQFNTRFILAADTAIVAKGAAKVLREDDPDEETCDDLLREFANVVSGNVVAILAKIGKSCEIQPPVSVGEEIDLGPAKGLVMPIVTPDGNGTLVLTFVSNSSSLR